MTSKEDLEYLYNLFENLTRIDYMPLEQREEIKQLLIKEYRNGNGIFEKIKQDLERLETLEKENQELKEKIRLTHADFGFNNLSDFRKQMRMNASELAKLKEAIEILKDKLDIKLTIYRNGGCTLEYKVNNQAMINDICLRHLDTEEFELLRKVLGNENSSLHKQK